MSATETAPAFVVIQRELAELRATLAEREAQLARIRDFVGPEHNDLAQRVREMFEKTTAALREREAEVETLRTLLRRLDGIVTTADTERDEARAALASRERDYLGQAVEIGVLRDALATARAEALEEAAKIIEPQPDNNPWSHQETRKALIEAANHLRALVSDTKE